MSEVLYVLSALRNLDVSEVTMIAMYITAVISFFGSIVHLICKDRRDSRLNAEMMNTWLLEWNSTHDGAVQAKTLVLHIECDDQEPQKKKAA